MIGRGLTHLSQKLLLIVEETSVPFLETAIAIPHQHLAVVFRVDILSLFFSHDYVLWVTVGLYR